VKKLVLMAAAAVMAVALAGPSQAANVIRYQAVLADPALCGTQANGDTTTAHGYVKIADIPNGFTVAEGDKLVYDILIDNGSTLNGGAVDLFPIDNAPGGGTLRDSWAMDQYGHFAHPAGTDYAKMPLDQSGQPLFQRGKWFHREVALTSSWPDLAEHLFLDATINAWNLTFDLHDTTHKQDVCPVDTKNANVIFYIRNVNFVDKDGKIKQALFNGEAKLPGGQDKLAGVTGDAVNGGYGLPEGTKSVEVAVVADPIAVEPPPTAGQ
jgi:hypothetical protein